jgi:hypothetical protein
VIQSPCRDTRMIDVGVCPPPQSAEGDALCAANNHVATKATFAFNPPFQDAIAKHRLVLHVHTMTYPC